MIGDLIKVDDVMLASLDEMERNGRVYSRDILQIQLIEDNTGRKLIDSASKECFAYFLKNCRLDFLEEDFLEHYSGSEKPFQVDRVDSESFEKWASDRSNFFRS